ncbi:MAG: hypothetical protein MJ222_00940 [Bacilli bacterium]|nr:hypothetical protein [Bacilli bacterium]
MKKSFLILLLPLLLASCGDEKDPGHTCVDNDNDHCCDVCSKKLTNCIDEDEDGVCDVCGEEFEEEREVYKITITQLPSKTSYVVGEIFDPTGMVVTVSYTDKSKEEVADYSYYNKPLKTTDKEIIISYEGKTAKVSIVVKENQEDLEEYTHTFDFNNDTDFANFKNATGFTDSDENKLSLKNYFDGQLEYLYLLDSIDLSGYICSRKRTDDSKYYLQLGSQKVEGTFVWHSTVKIYKVECEVINYTNGEYSVDRDAKFYIDSEPHTLLQDGQVPTKQTFPKNYDDGTTSFSISSSNGRVLVSKLTITWRG